ncbi:MAG: baseplate multidomain protein megatron [Alkalilacustris sp.]
MATIVLGAVGGAIGSGIGGTVLGLSGAALGQAAGATVGHALDQRLLGAGSRAVESGRLDRLRMTGASEGAPIPRIWGRIRVGGQVIWASQFLETSSSSRVGNRKTGTRVTEYSYSVSLAIALCEGEIVGVGRVWADGAELAADRLAMRVYAGGEDQLPDPRIEATEGQGNAPAYRGIAYVVIEDLDLAPFGNRVPQFSFEVLRSAEGSDLPDLMQGVRAVALIPGTGEASLATTPAETGSPVGPMPDLPGVLLPALAAADGGGRPVNVNTPSGRSDLEVALDQLTLELPQCRSVLLVVSWFGNDLRCGSCTLRPKVESRNPGPRWNVTGLDRDTAQQVTQLDGRAIYGGTPSDHAVREAIAALRACGQSVVFYPFVLMEQWQNNGLPDPWTGADDQPLLPWRGRITASVAPGRTNSPDGTAEVDRQVAAFFGQAEVDHFSIDGSEVVYSGPAEDWGFRRFILHYAALSKAAGGVDAFCVGSEMRGLTQLRGAGGFPAVEALRRLASDVRSILGPDVQISYAADWSEYFGYQSPEGDRYFHLDPFWADPNVDFIGIDNYMPLSDWRDGSVHADASWGGISNLGYLRSNVEGGEGFDWYYASDEDRDAQVRTAVTDGPGGEEWIWRFKDLRSWWESPHHERVGGVRRSIPTSWTPQSKPFWFTELGCPAVDRGSNQPNVFLDPKSSESDLPYYSSGRRDDEIQQQYLRAMLTYWSQDARNPVSPLYGGRMVDMGRAHVWAWDARPFPSFPALTEVWSDGPNWTRGHWITGRAASQPLANVVVEICERAGIGTVDVSALYGLVRGLRVSSTDTPRSVLQTLMLAHGFDATEREGVLVFRSRRGDAPVLLSVDDLCVRKNGDVELTRAAEADAAGRVRVSYTEAEADYDTRVVEVSLADDPGSMAAMTELPMVLLASEAEAIAERWLAEARIARDTLRLTIPLSNPLRAGDVFKLDLAQGRQSWRVDRIDEGQAREITAVRVEPGVYQSASRGADAIGGVGGGPRIRPFTVAAPVLPVFLDLPILTGEEAPHAPFIAVTGAGSSGPVAVFDSSGEGNFVLNKTLRRRASMGVTETALNHAAAGMWDRGPALRVRMFNATLSSESESAVIGGANAMAIGDGSAERWEVFQFTTARLVARGVWEISGRLRGQAGTDAVMPPTWPSGSLVVLLDGAPEQIRLTANQRGVARRYRVGPAERPLDDPTYVELVRPFSGIGLRPYAPVHLRCEVAEGSVRASWIRRTRVDGDSWSGTDVPIGEAIERYRVEVRQAGVVVRASETARSEWHYSAAERAQDGIAGPFTISVAQVSETYGPGPFTERYVDAQHLQS